MIQIEHFSAVGLYFTFVACTPHDLANCNSICLELGISDKIVILDSAQDSVATHAYACTIDGRDSIHR